MQFWVNSYFCSLYSRVSVIDVIVQRKLKKGFPCQFHKKTSQSVLLGVDRGKWEGRSQEFEGYVCLVGWWYLVYACYALDTTICFLHDFMLLPNNIPK